MSLQKARGVQPLSLTVEQRDGLTDKPVGLIIYNTTLDEAELWNGTVWITLGNVAGALTFKGNIDATTSGPTDLPVQAGDMYINTTAGTTTADWGNLSNTAVNVGDRLIYDGAQWTSYSSSAIPTLQQVTDAGSVSTNVISTGGLTTAGTVSTETLTVGGDGSVDGNLSTETLTVGDDGSVGGNLSVTGKATSAATVDADADATLTTKGYVDENSGIPDAESDGNLYGRQDGSWVEIDNTPGGVTQIVAGDNVTISPAGGTGAVTINSTGGGGGGTNINYNGASAWGNINGVSGALFGGLNCTVVKQSTGTYAVSFTTPMQVAIMQLLVRLVAVAVKGLVLTIKLLTVSQPIFSHRVVTLLTQAFSLLSTP